MKQAGGVTELLADLEGGDARAAGEILVRLYDPLRRIAQRQLASERPGHTLSATVLVHEVYLKLVDQDRASYQGRAHFLSVAAMAMRRILIDYAVQRATQKRGGGAPRVTLDDEVLGGPSSPEDLIAIDEAIGKLGVEHERASQVVVFRFFGGLTEEESALALGVSAPTIRRDWRFARAWLGRELGWSRPSE